LVAKIADVGQIKPVLDAGINLDKFNDQDARMIFEYVVSYYKNRKTMGNIPTRDLIEEAFPTVDLPKPDRLKLSAAVEEFLNHDVKARLAKLVDKMAEWQDVPEKILPEAAKEINALMRDKRVSVDIVVAHSLKAVAKAYEESKNRQTLKGIPYPWKLLNNETQGMLDGEYIIFYGRPKSLKTWLALHVMVYAYDYANRRILIYTREMSPEQMMNRCICLILGAPYEAYKKGYLHKIPHPYGGTMEDAFYGLMSTMREDEKGLVSLKSGKNKSLIITSDRQDVRGGGVSGLRRKIEDHEPDIVLADAVYLMRNDRKGVRSVKWDDQAAISQDLKEVAQDFNIPVVVTNQANRISEGKKGESASNMAFSDAYAQDCDLGIEILKKRIDREHNELALAITASREVNMAGFAIHGNPGNDFSVLKRPLVDQHGQPVKSTKTGKQTMVPVVFDEISEVVSFFKKDKDEDKIKAGIDVNAVHASINKNRKGKCD